MSAHNLLKIMDEAEVTRVVVVGQRSYGIPKDVANELASLRSRADAVEGLLRALDHAENELIRLRATVGQLTPVREALTAYRHLAGGSNQSFAPSLEGK
jgi:hypothetical protein